MSESPHSDDDPLDRSPEPAPNGERREESSERDLPIPVTDPDDPPVLVTETDEALVPVPAMDETAVELVRDAIGVARGEVSDERFSEKYGLAVPGGSEPE